jgi:hypothetical protein
VSGRDTAILRREKSNRTVQRDRKQKWGSENHTTTDNTLLTTRLSPLPQHQEHTILNFVQQHLSGFQTSSHKQSFFPQFRALAFRGETKLSYYSNLILSDLLGEDNRALRQQAHVNWHLNENRSRISTAVRIKQLYRLVRKIATNDYGRK